MFRQGLYQLPVYLVPLPDQHLQQHAILQLFHREGHPCFPGVRGH